MAGNEVLYGPAGGITHPARQDVPTPTRKHQQPGMESRRPGGGTGLLQPEAIKTASQAAWPVSKYKKRHAQINDAPAALSPATGKIQPPTTKSTALHEGRA